MLSYLLMQIISEDYRNDPVRVQSQLLDLFSSYKQSGGTPSLMGFTFNNQSYNYFYLRNQHHQTYLVQFSTFAPGLHLLDLHSDHYYLFTEYFSEQDQPSINIHMLASSQQRISQTILQQPVHRKFNNIWKIKHFSSQGLIPRWPRIMLRKKIQENQLKKPQKDGHMHLEQGYETISHLLMITWPQKSQKEGPFIQSIEEYTKMKDQMINQS